ncbi:autophagy protein [Coemansia sp. RSA 2559]|nr:autophagy protein [Coemansia sp. RSA 2559]KAJ2866839.1 autophagy protein [Coemansia erecta]
MSTSTAKPNTLQSCKRCSKKLGSIDASWKNASIDALAQTLPVERTRELKAAMSALYIQQMHSKRDSGGDEPRDLTDISRFFSHSFRTDKMNRLDADVSGTNDRRGKTGSGGMRGSMALVLDKTALPPTKDNNYYDLGESERAEEEKEGEETHYDNASDSNTGNHSAQSESFILLSSSQIHPYMFPMDSASPDQQLLRQQSTIKELEGLSMSTYNGAANERNIGSKDNSALDAPVALPLPDQQHQQPDDIAEKFEIIGRIMDMLDDHSTLSHPMCEDCAETMLRLMDRQLADSLRERQIVEGIGETAQAASKQHGDGTVPEDIAGLERELGEQEEMERMLEETLNTLDTQLDAICRQITNLQTESQRLEADEDQQNQQRNDLEYALERCESEQWALDDKYARLAAQLTQLQRTNVYNDVFNIAVGDGIASINGFRLGGRSAPHNVEWAEVNAAWGQALLLLQTVARRLGHEFSGYRLIPMGAFSRIERISEDGAAATVLELFGSGDMYLGRLFQTRRFDSAMVAFLACLDQIAQLVTGINPQLRLPYKIDHDKVGGVSIKPQFGQDDAWTKACKNTLMDARWALAFASSYDNPA